MRALSVMKTRWSSPLPLRVTLCSSAKSPATFACSKSRRVPIGKLFSKKNKPRSSLTLPLTTLWKVRTATGNLKCSGRRLSRSCLMTSSLGRTGGRGDTTGWSTLFWGWLSLFILLRSLGSTIWLTKWSSSLGIRIWSCSRRGTSTMSLLRSLASSTYSSCSSFSTVYLACGYGPTNKSTRWPTNQYADSTWRSSFSWWTSSCSQAPLSWRTTRRTPAAVF